MRILSLQVTGFLGRKEPLTLKFNDDLNIITGYNGAGKTNLLKLIWYTVSGNTHALLDEVEFGALSLSTSLYTVNIFKLSRHTCRGNFAIPGEGVEEYEDEYFAEDEIASDARDALNNELRPRGSSLFFPTFRRIEGGFTIGGSSRIANNSLFNAPRVKGELADAIAAISRKMSNGDHVFVTSIATTDIAELLMRQYNEMSEEANSLQSQMSQDVISKIRDFRRDTAFEQKDRIGAEAVDTLESIRSLIENVDRQRERAMAPMAAVQAVVTKIFKHKGIQVNRRVSFGDTVNAISSDLLSAGEKQMLSFICYNAFTDSSPIFIDEPELSLHVDWQRILFPTLEAQKKSNQFIIATHSPFIYSKYPEKEIALVDHRGDEVADNA